MFKLYLKIRAYITSTFNRFILSRITLCINLYKVLKYTNHDFRFGNMSSIIFDCNMFTKPKRASNYALIFTDKSGNILELNYSYIKYKTKNKTVIKVGSCDILEY